MRRRNQAIAYPHLCHCCFCKTISLSQELNEGNINLYDRCGDLEMFISKIVRVLCYFTIIDHAFMEPDERSTRYYVNPIRQSKATNLKNINVCSWQN